MDLCRGGVEEKQKKPLVQFDEDAISSVLRVSSQENSANRLAEGTMASQSVPITPNKCQKIRDLQSLEVIRLMNLRTGMKDTLQNSPLHTSLSLAPITPDKSNEEIQDYQPHGRYASNESLRKEKSNECMYMEVPPQVEQTEPHDGQEQEVGSTKTPRKSAEKRKNDRLKVIQECTPAKKPKPGKINVDQHTTKAVVRSLNFDFDSQGRDGEQLSPMTGSSVQETFACSTNSSSPEFAIMLTQGQEVAVNELPDVIALDLSCSQDQMLEDHVGLTKSPMTSSQPFSRDTLSKELKNFDDGLNGIPRVQTDQGQVNPDIYERWKDTRFMHVYKRKETIRIQSNSHSSSYTLKGFGIVLAIEATMGTTNARACKPIPIGSVSDHSHLLLEEGSGLPAAQPFPRDTACEESKIFDGCTNNNGLNGITRVQTDQGQANSNGHSEAIPTEDGCIEDTRHTSIYEWSTDKRFMHVYKRKRTRTISQVKSSLSLYSTLICRKKRENKVKALRCKKAVSKYTDGESSMSPGRFTNSEIMLATADPIIRTTSVASTNGRRQLPWTLQKLKEPGRRQLPWTLQKLKEPAGRRQLPWTLQKLKEPVVTSRSKKHGPPPEGGTIVPYEPPFGLEKKKRTRPRVDIDTETDREWKLLMGSERIAGNDGPSMDKEKWWEEERQICRVRVDTFISRMHLIQGNRRLSKWKGSVVDSVVGVFLTQNVSDDLSSDAFMYLSARFPPGSSCDDEDSHSERTNMPKKEGAESITAHDDVIKQRETKSTSEPYDPGSLGAHESGNNAAANDSGSLGSNSGHGLHNPKGEVLHVDEGSCLPSSSFESIKRCSTITTEELGSCSTGKKILTSDSKIKTVDSHVSLGKQCLQSQNCTLSNNISNRAPQVQDEETSEVLQEEREADKSSFKGKASVTKNRAKKGIRSTRGKKMNAETGKKNFDWDCLRKAALANCSKKYRSHQEEDSVDWDAVRCADIEDIAKALEKRGMHNVLAERIKDFLNRLVKDHDSTDLEWLRDVPPDEVKEYLLSVRGLGLKSAECVRLLTLHQLAFPVDTNVARVCVRLGWVPLQPLPDSVQLHLLTSYPMNAHIQKYLWPRLCKLDQETLYELHYQMITFGKVFCTKRRPNCNACPMRLECKHFASEYASARLLLPGPMGKSLVTSIVHMASKNVASKNDEGPSSSLPPQPQFEDHMYLEGSVDNNLDPPIESPPAAEQDYGNSLQSDIEDFYVGPDYIPKIELNLEDFTGYLQYYLQENNVEVEGGDISKAIVPLSDEVASIPMPAIRNVSHRRTEHLVYELPDMHELLKRMDQREANDPTPYLLLLRSPGGTEESIEPPQPCCSFQSSGELCHRNTCSHCNKIREDAQIVSGTILVPCRTATRGSFPLNGTHFQVNEVFADHSSSCVPIDVPKESIRDLPRRKVYFGNSVSSIFRGLTTEETQQCFWRGSICLRGFERESREPKSLLPELHPPSEKDRHQGNNNTSGTA